jgi:hypothetical protein
MFAELTTELLDLSVSVKGRKAEHYALLILCCSCSCCTRSGGGEPS